MMSLAGRAARPPDPGYDYACGAVSSGVSTMALPGFRIDAIDNPRNNNAFPLSGQGQVSFPRTFTSSVYLTDSHWPSSPSSFTLRTWHVHLGKFSATRIKPSMRLAFSFQTITLPDIPGHLGSGPGGSGWLPSIPCQFTNGPILLRNTTTFQESKFHGS